jgi:hypothetical protein
MSSISVAGDVSGAISIAAPSAAGSGVLTLPTGTDTLIGKATTDTLTNKTLTSPVLTTPALGTVASGNISACTSTNMVLVTPSLGTPSALVGTNISGTANSLNAGIGVNQTWTDVTASRFINSTYTNSTGKPITVNITFQAGVSINSGLLATVGGFQYLWGTYGSSSYSGRGSITFLVPAGLTYSVVNNSSAVGALIWAELI